MAALECVKLIVFFRILICALLDVKNWSPAIAETHNLLLQFKVIDVTVSHVYCSTVEQVATAS